MYPFTRGSRQMTSLTSLPLWLVVVFLFWFGIWRFTAREVFSAQGGFPLSHGTQISMAHALSPRLPADSLPHLLEQLEHHLPRLVLKRAAGQDISEERESLRQLLTSLHQADDVERRRLAHIAQRLHKQRFSPLIQQRHADTSQQYHDQMTSLFTRLTAMVEETDQSGEQTDAGQALLAHLKALRQQVSPRRLPHVPLLLDRFPHQAKALTSPREVEHPKKAEGAFPSNEREELMTVATFGEPLTLVGQVPSSPLPPPTETDLAEDGIDIVFTPQLRARAAQLDFNPVRIFEFVLNEIDYEPYDGSRKGAHGTLMEGAGNDVDIASLLIALFRISGFPARYVLGEVEVNARQALSWLKVSDLMTAGQILASNDVPVIVILEEGQPVALQKFHVWVEVYLPFAFYRGLRLPGGDGPKRWSPLDASFKPHRFQVGTDLLSQAGIDPAQAQARLTQAVETDHAGSVTAFQVGGIESLGRQVYDQVRGIVPPGSPIQDGRGRWSRVERRHGILPAAIDLRMIRRDRRTAILDNTLRHHVRIQLSYWPRGLAVDESEGGIDLMELDLLIPTAQLWGKRLTLSYYPATPEDQAVIDEFGGRLTVPPYL
ncbi:MAG: hypothetical protein HY731_12110, partial [Candidatus Tectomicrobia bacterium]|nr:hypothetical protein [Candidatus Tectomicrobia bacterium]